jgi:hypothetical protein
MAYFGITATETGLQAANRDDLAVGLARLLARRASGAPVVVLVHGYRFDPGQAAADPHRSLFAFRPPSADRRVRSWPAGLGIADDDGESGLAIGFAWPAAVSHLAALVRHRRTGFAVAYQRAGALGAGLAALIGLIRSLAPSVPVDVLAHSLGARVALAALPHLDCAPARMILLGAAEIDARAHEALEMMRVPVPPQIYNVTARANDVYDLAFECFAPRRSWGERAVGAGLRNPPPYWVDVQLDRADVTRWINGQGIPLTPSRARLCHWSFYTRDGAMAVYQAILRDRSGWDVASLRQRACFQVQEPRWSRLVPRRPRGVALPSLAMEQDMHGVAFER